MAGAGRRSGYRKGVTSDVLDSFPEPGPADSIVRVTGLRGTNIMEVLTAGGETSLAMLPTKFRKLIWVKRGDFVMCTGTDGSADLETRDGKGGKVNFMVTHILYEQQKKHLVSKGMWPEVFATAVAKEAAVAVPKTKHKGAEEGAGGGGSVADTTASTSSAAAAAELTGAMADASIFEGAVAGADGAGAAAPADGAGAAAPADGAGAAAAASAEASAHAPNMIGGIDMSQYEYEESDEEDGDAALWVNPNKKNQGHYAASDSSSDNDSD